MKIENWFNATKELPDHSGEYIIKKNNSETVIPVFFLKDNDSILLNSGFPDLTHPENRLLYALSKYMVQVKITNGGFYKLITDKNGKETLKKVPLKGIFWSSRKIKQLNYSKRKKTLKNYWKEESLSDEDVTKRIESYIKNDGKLLFVYKNIEKTFSEEYFDFCGVRYETNPLIIKRAFLKTLNYRNVIKNLAKNKYLDNLKILTDDVRQDNKYTLDEALKIRDELYTNLEAEGVFPEDIKTILDAFFINLFLPTKKDIIKVLYKDETGKSGYVSKDMFLVKVFHRYQIIDAIRQIGRVQFNSNIPNDSLLDSIAIMQLTENFAIGKFKIVEFKEDFKEEMGVS